MFVTVPPLVCKGNMACRLVAPCAAVIEKLKGHPLFAHITLLRSERSPIAALVTEMLEEISPGALP